MNNAISKQMEKRAAPRRGARARFAVMLALMLVLTALATPSRAAPAPVTCVDPQLQTDLLSGTAAYINAAIANTRNVFEMSPRSDIRNSQCLGSGFFSFFDVVRALLSGINAMVILVGTLVRSIINLICNYVSQEISNLISSALSLLCLPTLPGLNFGLPALGGLGRASCNGTPLLSFGSGGGYSMPGGVPTFYDNMSRGIPGSGGSFRF